MSAGFSIVKYKMQLSKNASFNQLLQPKQITRSYRQSACLRINVGTSIFSSFEAVDVP